MMGLGDRKLIYQLVRLNALAYKMIMVVPAIEGSTIYTAIYISFEKSGVNAS